MRVLLVALAATMLTAACATQANRYSHRSADQAQFLKDRHVCLSHSTRRGGEVNGDMFDACMGERGYSKDFNGRFVS